MRILYFITFKTFYGHFKDLKLTQYDQNMKQNDSNMYSVILADGLI